ncbi:MAG: hypothetical protein IFNCLDLE_02604 [Ignavibacteriaceae bacterium]|nr:hypothetical protein [Ignavibacteriaceae bacterium]
MSKITTKIENKRLFSYSSKGGVNITFNLSTDDMTELEDCKDILLQGLKDINAAIEEIKNGKTSNNE